MTSIVRWSLNHKRLVVAIWLLLTIAGIGSANKATKALSDQYSNPGHESYTTDQTIAAKFGNGGSGAPMLAVVTLPAGASATSHAVNAELQSVDSRIEHAVCVPKISSMSCDQAVFVNQAADASLSSNVVLVEVGRFG